MICRGVGRVAMRRVTLALACAALGESPWFASPADACSILATFEGVLPLPGCSLPRTAGILLRGLELSTSGLQVEIDGGPVSAEFVEHVYAPSGEPVGRVLAVGNTVEGDVLALSGELCEDCPIDVEFTVTPEDTRLDHVVVEVAYDVHDWNPEDPAICEQVCQDDDLAFYVSVEVEFAEQDDSPSPLLLDVRSSGAELGTFSRTLALETASSVVYFGAHSSEVAGVTQLCFEARVRDTSGNASPWYAAACRPCRTKTETADVPEACGMEAPDWDREPADVGACLVGEPAPPTLPGYACNSEESTGGSDDTSTSAGGSSDHGDAVGCSCSADGPHRPALLASLTVLILFRASRRRRFVREGMGDADFGPS